MTETAIQIQVDGTIEIYRNERTYRRMPGNDGEPRWFKLTSRGLRPVSKSRARRLERIYQDPATKKFRRFPRLESDLKLGQPVFHAVFGYGTVAAIKGDNITFFSKKDSAVTHTVKALDLTTRSQAEVGLETCYFEGGAKAWRRAAGRWASVYKNLSMMEGKGKYGDWLKRHGLNRSSMDDLIRRFEDEATREAQERLVLPESGKTDETNPTAATELGVSPYAVTGLTQVNERTPDPENDERQKNIQAETSKRAGIKPTFHKTILYLQRRQLDPEKLALYHAIKEGDKKSVDAIMQRKIDEGIEDVLALAPDAIHHNQKSRPNRRQKRVSLRRPQRRRTQVQHVRA